MTQPLTLSNAPLEHPGMDYARLRSEGIKTIAKLAGSRWTDYNSADPGITILEALCYAITDLSYRLSFEIEDLLAAPPGESRPPLFLTAQQVLTINPLTINDYRKVLIDIEGVKNAWLEPIDAPEPAIYYDASTGSLSFSQGDFVEPVYIQGLYRVLLEKEPTYRDQPLIQAATAKLQQRRNLCEDFAEIRVLPIETITVRAEIEIADQVDPNRLMAQLYTAMAADISPSLGVRTLPELLEQGMPVEDIFAGPVLEQGFIDDDQLQQFQRKTELHASDLIQVILNQLGVKTVRSLTLVSDRSPTPEIWDLDLDPQLTPSLKAIAKAIAAGDIQFYKGQIPCPLDAAKVNGAVAVLAAQSPQTLNRNAPKDLPIPTGDYRELADYETIQNEFPLAYGIGDIGLPASAPDPRKAQAKQLQAYLMVFDQLLANYFAQLEHLRDLFSLSDIEMHTYFTQSIAHFPAGQAVLSEAYADYLQKSPVSDPVELDRKNRLLDHLLAQYSETFTDYSLLFAGADLSTLVLKHKAAWVQHYPQVSAGRGQALNYTLDPNNTETFETNISGLKQRVARLLGITPSRQFLYASDDTEVEGFYLVEHLLLRPRTEDVPQVDLDAAQDTSLDFLSFSEPITAFQASSQPGYVTCLSEGHALKAGDRLDLFFSMYYNGTYTATNITANTFDIQHELVAGDVADSGAWVRSQQNPDPFSFQLSVVLPDWPARFREENFRQLILQTLIAETPAHISLHVHWFNKKQMQEFEPTYAIWLQQLAGRADGIVPEENYASRLLALLEIGSKTFYEPPTSLGYMTVVENEDDAVENPFIIM
ncbi:MAG: hypothetical protein F6J87_28145 [Spirulina sp. SIO3F2]|nr:hypothetical protein [Spirulina sp. SIO3F2]